MGKIFGPGASEPGRRNPGRRTRTSEPGTSEPGRRTLGPERGMPDTGPTRTPHRTQLAKLIPATNPRVAAATPASSMPSPLSAADQPRPSSSNRTVSTLAVLKVV